MARLLNQHTFATATHRAHQARSLDLGRLFVTLLQVGVLGGIGLLIVLAVVNTVLGTGTGETVTAPYS